MAPIDRCARASRLLADAAERGTPIAALGGVAIQLTCPSAQPGGPWNRELADIDLATTAKARRQVEQLIAEHDFAPDEPFNQMNGSTRLRYFDADGSHLDVFVDELVLCHTVTWRRRLVPGATTLPLAELLLTKLQVVKQEAKDRGDLSALLADRWEQLLAEMPALSGTVRRDWGLWRTGGISLQSLAGASEGVVKARALELRERWLGFPLTAAAKLRGSVGDRVRWYQEPEEV